MFAALALGCCVPPLRRGVAQNPVGNVLQFCRRYRLPRQEQTQQAFRVVQTLGSRIRGLRSIPRGAGR